MSREYWQAVYNDWRHPRGKWPMCLGGDTRFGWWLGDVFCKLGHCNIFCRGREKHGGISQV